MHGAIGSMITFFSEQAMVRILILSLLAVAPNALAYDSDGVKTHFGREIAECAAYYAIAAEVSNRFGNVTAGMKLQQDADRAMEMGRMLTTEELARTRYETALEAEAKTNNSKNGYAKLVRRYDRSCQVMMEHPEQRIEYWEKKK